MRSLVIASYNGPRRDKKYSATHYLRGQLETLSRFKHNLDDVIVVVNESPMTEEYQEVLKGFTKVLYRPNIQGSRGAWNFAFETFKDQYEWFFYVEDDYRFNLDNFDQKLIDMWEPGVGHLCSCAYTSDRIGYHIAMTCGLISSEGFKAADFSIFNQHWDGNIYTTEYQKTWDDAFINSSLKVKSIVPTYDVHYLDIQGLARSWCDAPDIILPIQENLEWYWNPPPPPPPEPPAHEIMWDRHRIRLMSDPFYRETWGE